MLAVQLLALLLSLRRTGNNRVFTRGDYQPVTDLPTLYRFQYTIQRANCSGEWGYLGRMGKLGTVPDILVMPFW